jgi:hypothetical protein
MSEIPRVITHRRFGSRIAFSSAGIVLHPIFRQPIPITWAEIDFVSAIPAAQQVEGKWGFRDFRLSHGWDILRDHGRRFVLDIVVHDRHALEGRLRWNPVGLRPLWTAEDKPDPRQGTFPIELRVRRLDAKATDLLELVARHCRFDLLCHGD